MRVFLTHNPEDLKAYYGRALPEMKALPDVKVLVNQQGRDLATTELIEAAAGCHVIVAHRSTPGMSQLFAESPSLVAFLRCAVDISTIDVDAASEHGILVARADKAFVPSTAELAIGLLLAVARNIAVSAADYHSARIPQQRAGFQLRDQTAAILGYGAIGSYLADALIGLGMNVVVHDPASTVDRSDITQVSFVEALVAADVVFPLAQADSSTENMIDANALEKMKRGAVLVNVSRGELLDEGAVAAALDTGHLLGVGLDVGRAADQRPSPSLAARPEVVATPHLGGLTPQNADAQARSSVEQVKAMIEHSMPPRAVNESTAHRLRTLWRDDS